MADTVAVMNKGRIEQMGTPEDLYENPKTVFVATFLGQSNLWAGEASDKAADAVIVSVAGDTVRVPSHRSVVHRGRLTVGVRPEKILLHEKRPAASARLNTIGPGRVRDASFSGASTQYQVDVPGWGLVQVFAQNASGGQHFRQGDLVHLSWEVEHTFGLAEEPPPSHKFDPDTDTGALAVAEKEKLQTELESS